MVYGRSPLRRNTGGAVDLAVRSLSTLPAFSAPGGKCSPRYRADATNKWAQASLGDPEGSRGPVAPAPGLHSREPGSLRQYTDRTPPAPPSVQIVSLRFVHSGIGLLFSVAGARSAGRAGVCATILQARF